MGTGFFTHSVLYMIQYYAQKTIVVMGCNYVLYILEYFAEFVTLQHGGWTARLRQILIFSRNFTPSTLR